MAPSEGWLSEQLQSAFAHLWKDPTPRSGGLRPALEWLGRALRQSGNLRVWSRPGRDQLVAPGEWVELSLDLGLAAARGAAGVRFRVGGERVGEAPVVGASVELAYAPASAGLHRVEAIPIDEAGAEIGLGLARCTSWLHVVDRAPVAAVDADLLLGESVELQGVRRLSERGWAVCYVDVHSEDREARIRAALVAHDLPGGAVLVHPDADAEFATLGLDFRRAFSLTCLRRARGRGVATVLLVCDDPAGRALPALEGLTALAPEELPHDLGDDPRITALEEEAAAQVAEREERGRDFSWRLDRMTGTRLSLGNECRVELDNRRAREAVFAAIESARRSVHMQFYILEDCRFSEHLAVRLIARARQGIRVRILVDALYSGEPLPAMRNAVAEVLRQEPNIEVLASSPLDPNSMPDAASLKHRDHRKLIVVDGTRAFVSGRNAGDPYYTGFEEVPVTDGTAHERIPWVDAHVEVRGPIVGQVQHAFLADWTRQGGEAPGPAEDPFPELQAVSDCAARLILQGEGDASVLSSYEAILDGARRRVTILNGFPVFPTLTRAIRRAARRGVAVTLISGCALTRRGDGSFLRGSLHRELLEHLTKQSLEPLLAIGVEVYEFATAPLPTVVSRGGLLRPYVHAKVVCADGQVASIGSANLDATASYWEREANLVIEDEPLVTGLEAELRRLAAQSYRIDPESTYWKQEASQREVTARLWPNALYS